MRKPFAAFCMTLLLVVAGAVLSLAQSSSSHQHAGGHSIVAPDQVKWGPAPPALPPGAQAAIIDGDPGTAGMFTIRLKFPDSYGVPPHSHPTDEHVTVLSGTLMVGHGSKLDAGSMKPLATGGYAKMAKGMDHYVRAQGETTVQVSGMGPFQLKYANPADDPRQKTAEGKKE